MKTRLNKFIADSGVCSRRAADVLIESGEVKLNGEIVKEFGIKVDPEEDRVEINGKTLSADKNFLYYALYKPKGFISTSECESDQKKITDLVPDSPRVFSVGRLDKDSEGLIILTNDGDLTKRLTHPSFEHEKEYEVRAISPSENNPTEFFLKKRFIEGIDIDGKKMKADSLDNFFRNGRSINFRLVLHTGYNRQIRKMCAKMNLEVTKLTRIRIGKLTLSDLGIKSGEYKTIDRSAIL